MEFDKSRIYTAVNADELKIGSTCIFADTIQALRQKVQGGFTAGDCAEDYFRHLTEIYGDDNVERFVVDDCTYIYAYLIDPPAEPKYNPFESVEDAMKAIKAHGGWVENSLGTCWLITGYATKKDINNLVHIANNWVSLESLFRHYVFSDDGSPCGVLIEE